MVKVVVSDLNPKKSKSQRAAVAKKRVRTKDGRFVDVISLDANSAAFGSGLTYTFKRNVAKARKDNKQKFGSADGVRSK